MHLKSKTIGMRNEMNKILLFLSACNSLKPNAKFAGNGVDRNFPCLHMSYK